MVAFIWFAFSDLSLPYPNLLPAILQSVKLIGVWFPGQCHGRLGQLVSSRHRSVSLALGGLWGKHSFFPLYPYLQRGVGHESHTGIPIGSEQGEQYAGTRVHSWTVKEVSAWGKGLDSGHLKEAFHPWVRNLSQEYILFSTGEKWAWQLWLSRQLLWKAPSYVSL